MGTYAKTAGSRTRNNTKRLRRTALWFAALWPASLHPGFGGTWLAHSRHGCHRLRWRATYALALCLTNLPATMTPDRWGRTCRVRPVALLPWWPLRRGAGKKAARRPAGYSAHGPRRHVKEGALAATIVMMISALAAFAMNRADEAGPPQGDAGQSYAHHGANHDGHRFSLNTRGRSTPHGRTGVQGQDGRGDSTPPSHDLDTTLVSDNSDDRALGEPRGRGDLPWEESTGDGPTLTHFFGSGMGNGGFGGAGGAGGFGGGGGGNGGGGNGGHSGDGSPHGPGPSQGDPGGPNQPTDPTSPSPPWSPDHPTRPPVVDPDPCAGACSPPSYPQQPASPILSAVPEPHTWLMMIVGFSVVGGALRRRRRSETSSRLHYNV